jgi:hypothetical protein
MPAESANRKPSSDLLRQVLLDYLRSSKVVGWPGADGLTDDDIVNCYPQAISAGEAPGWHELQGRFPALAGELHALRSAKGWLEPFSSHDRNQLIACCEFESSLRHSQGGIVMQADVNQSPQDAEGDVHCRLSRWLVSFATESGWYPVGEFLALDAAAAIERAVEVLGTGAAYHAEEIPWDAAPLSRAHLPPAKN